MSSLTQRPREESIENPLDLYKKKFKRFSGLSRRQLGVFLVSAFSFIVSFSWNTLAQNLFNTIIPPNVKNSQTILLLTQFLYALFITLVGAVTIAYVNSRPRRVQNTDSDTCCAQIRKDVRELKSFMENHL